MRKFILLGFLLVLCLALCACGEGAAQPGTEAGTATTTTTPTTSTPPTTTNPTTSGHEHSYTQTVTAPDCTNGGYTTNTCQCGDSYVSDEVAALGHTWTSATCSAPKTCTVCSATEGTAAGHSYVQGKCSACGEAQAGYKALTACGWRTAGLIPGGEELDVITLWLNGEDSSIGAGYYAPLSALDPDLQEERLEYPEDLVDFNGEKYYSKGFGDFRPASYTEQGDTVVLSVLEDEVVGTITMVRTAANQYTVTGITGKIIDSTITSCLVVGSVFTAVE